MVDDLLTDGELVEDVHIVLFDNAAEAATLVEIDQFEEAPEEFIDAEQDAHGLLLVGPY